MVVVSDTGPINYLVLIGQVELLHHLYGKILLPPAVHAELTQPRTPPEVAVWVRNLPNWVEVRTPKTTLPNLSVDPGEREAISLALEVNASLVLMDDRLGRTEARQQGLDVIGTLGILDAAASRGLVDLSKALHSLRETNFRGSPVLFDEMLRRHSQTS